MKKLKVVHGVGTLKYNMYKTSFQSEDYMNINMPNKFVIAHSRLRLVSHSIAVEIVLTLKLQARSILFEE